MILEASKNDAKQKMSAVQHFLWNSRKGMGGCPIITSGLGLSLVMVPLGPLSLASRAGNYLGIEKSLGILLCQDQPSRKYDSEFLMLGQTLSKRI